MTNECYEPLDFRADILEVQEPYNYSIICFDECLVEGVPITRNCLHESCFEVDVARGFLTSAFSSDFDKIYFYVGTVEMILLADSPIPINLLKEDGLLKIGALKTNNSSIEFLNTNESMKKIGGRVEQTPIEIKLNSITSSVNVGSVITALERNPILLNFEETQISSGTKITATIPNNINLLMNESYKSIGSTIEAIYQNKEILSGSGHEIIIGTVLVSQIGELILKKIESHPSIGVTALSEGAVLDLSGFSHEIYHVIRETLEKKNVKASFDIFKNLNGKIDGKKEIKSKIEVLFNKTGQIEINYYKNGIIESSKQIEVKL